MKDIEQENDAILVVDDDPALRRALSRILRHEGHTVIEAESGPSALELTRKHRPSLLVLDYAMPGMDGEMALDELRKELRDDAPPAVLLTASGREQERALAMGAVKGLPKPFAVEELLETIARHKRGDASRRS
jgi:CheY-like chemotaxis protein